MPTANPAATAAAPPVRELDPVLLDAIPQDAVAVVHLDLDAMKASKDWNGLFTAVHKMAPTEEWNRQCGFDVIGAAREGVVAIVSIERLVLALRLDGIDDERATKCALAIGGEDAKASTVAGRGGATVANDFVFVAKDGVALFGTRETVEGAAARVGAASRDRAGILARLPRGPGMLLSAACALSLEDGTSVNGTYAVQSEELGLHVDLGQPSAREASELAGSLQTEMRQDAAVILAQTEKAAAEGGDGEKVAARAVRRLLDSVVIQASGDHVLFDLGLQGKPEEIASAFGVMAGTGTYGFRRYLANAKIAEAKTTVGAVARALGAKVQEDVEAEKKKKGGKVAKVRFPASTGLTPPSVPAGTKFVPGADTWSHPTWKAIRFRIAVPIFYSYEIEVSRDGKSAIVRARGDLDGDGVLSTFELPMQLSPQGDVLIATQVQIDNEFE